MTRANMFILYSASSRNVTLSPRSGRGRFPPVPKLVSQVPLPGTINAGLAFRLHPGAPLNAKIAYSVIAGVVGLAYLGVHLLVGMHGISRRQERKREPNYLKVGSSR
ncbi:hypothetical protein BDV38DRAFT_92897 [Aspergillus pseudotamarii]|uniref:Uncharacterized protein n=1 Tax=Aspergillus pseudotamarii TaxID=132259 RepID=A0A5N6T982_ASPPS|nr:uncharacterized protein BDV38DRAFT_92897 [Aspergillus pseudotamarii]KAE8142739.1 hypothetical protein BDV38DRAFT_92897 [Aspergillus pseudotamarii]